MANEEVLEGEKRVGNRSAMPVIASVVDELRAQGIGVKVLYARENGIERGVRPQWVDHGFPPDELVRISQGRRPK